MNRIVHITFILLFAFVFTVAAAPAEDSVTGELSGAPVTVSIESFDRSFAYEEVNAFTFEQALREAAKKSGINIVYSSDGHVYSVNGVEEKRFGGQDGWYGCVVRGGSVVKPDNYLKFTLESGDKVTLYYGDPQLTKIVTEFALNANGNNITFELSAARTVRIWKEGRWVQEKSADGLGDAIIRVRTPDGSQRVLKTDENGVAVTQFDKTGFYRYYAEGYASGSCPSFVRTEDYTYLYGVADESAVTRGEAAAFLVNLFGVKQGAGEKTFTDVTLNTPNYSEIVTAASAGVVSGYDDGHFQPDDPVTLAQLCAMAAAVLPEAGNGAEEAKDAPEWVREKAGRVAASGLLNGVELNWEAPVGREALNALYANSPLLGAQI